MKSSTQQLESASTPGIFQPVFSGSNYGPPVHLPYVGVMQQPPEVSVAAPPPTSAVPMLKQSRYMSTGGSITGFNLLPPSTGGVSSGRPLRKGGGSNLLAETELSLRAPSQRGVSPDYARSYKTSVKKRRSVLTSQDLPDLDSPTTPRPISAPKTASILKTNPFEANFSLFNTSASALGGGHASAGLVADLTSVSSTAASAAAAAAAVVHQDTWNIFSAAHSGGAEVDVSSPGIGAVDLGFAHELSTDGLADSLLNTATAAAEQQQQSGVPVAPFTLPGILDSDLAVDPGSVSREGGGPGGGGVPDLAVWSEASLLAGTQVLSSQQTDTSSTASSSPGNALSNQQSAAALSAAVNNRLPREEQVNRPELSEAMIEELNDVIEFKKDERYQKHIIPYREKISFAIGEGGRELLRACLNVRGCKGRQLQGASVPVLLQLAHQWNLWDVALRIKIERQTGQLSSAHEAFVRFKATQSQMRKFVRKEYMVTERDQLGKIARIHYDENRKIKLGKDGREALRAKLRRLHDKHASRMDELLAQHGFKYSELRNATVQQLGRMAFVCNLWDQVISACRSQEEKRDGKGNRIPRPGTDLKLPEDLINAPIVTDENGQMSNDDARRTMDAVSQLLQQNNYPQAADNSPDLFNSTTFAQAFGNFGAFDTSSQLSEPIAASGASSDLVDVKEEPRDEDDDEDPSPVLEYYNDEVSSPEKGGAFPTAACYHHGSRYLNSVEDTTAIDPSTVTPPVIIGSQRRGHAEIYNNFDPSTGGFF